MSNIGAPLFVVVGIGIEVVHNARYIIKTKQLKNNPIFLFVKNRKHTAFVNTIFNLGGLRQSSS